MNNKQDQNTSEGSSAIQVGGNATINQGVPAQVIDQLVIGLSTQIAQLRDEARDIAERRAFEFKQELLRKFSNPERANLEAFREPDFGLLLLDAQRASIRRDDPDVDRTLTDLIAERSLSKANTRIALTMNQAVSVAGLLTNEEYVALSLIVLIRGGLSDRRLDRDLLQGQLIGYLDYVRKNISLEPASYHYLVSYGCASFMPTTGNAASLFTHTCGGIMQRSFSIGATDELTASILKQLTVPSSKELRHLQFDAVSHKEFLEKATQVVGDLRRFESSHLQKEFLSELTSVYERSCNLSPDSEIRQGAPKNTLVFDGRSFIEVPWTFDVRFSRPDNLVSKLNDLLVNINHLWASTPLGGLNLTPVGVAIGHAYLRRFFADVFRKGSSMVR